MLGVVVFNNDALPPKGTLYNSLDLFFFSDPRLFTYWKSPQISCSAFVCLSVGTKGDTHCYAEDFLDDYRVVYVAEEFY